MRIIKFKNKTLNSSKFQFYNSPSSNFISWTPCKPQTLKERRCNNQNKKLCSSTINPSNLQISIFSTHQLTNTSVEFFIRPQLPFPFVVTMKTDNFWVLMIKILYNNYLIPKNINFTTHQQTKTSVELLNLHITLFDLTCLGTLRS